MGLVGNCVRHKQRIVISDYIFAGSLAVTGEDDPWGLKGSIGSKSMAPAYSAGQRPSRGKVSWPKLWENLVQSLLQKYSNICRKHHLGSVSQIKRSKKLVSFEFRPFGIRTSSLSNAADRERFEVYRVSWNFGNECPVSALGDISPRLFQRQVVVLPRQPVMENCSVGWGFLSYAV